MNTLTDWLKWLTDSESFETKHWFRVRDHLNRTLKWTRNWCDKHLMFSWRIVLRKWNNRNRNINEFDIWLQLVRVTWYLDMKYMNYVCGCSEISLESINAHHWNLESIFWCKYFDSEVPNWNTNIQDLIVRAIASVWCNKHVVRRHSIQHFEFDLRLWWEHRKILSQGCVNNQFSQWCSRCIRRKLVSSAWKKNRGRRERPFCWWLKWNKTLDSLHVATLYFTISSI